MRIEKVLRFVFHGDRECNKYLKKDADNKALRGNPSQTPTQRLDCEGLRQCNRSRSFFIDT
jgi:hypothetical protein